MATEFESQWLLEIKRVEPQGKASGYILGVIQWIIDGDPKNPVLEKREVYGNGNTGKCKGMNLGDLLAVEEKMDEVKALLTVEKKSAP